MNNFQRIGSVSNAHIGREFEDIALNYFKKNNIHLIKDASLPIGINEVKKNHRFDLGTSPNVDNKVIVECKSHRWTSGDNVPSAKLTVWNEAMYYFYLAPNGYRKIFFILRDFSVKRNETLGEYYVRTYKHLIPEDVEIMEYDSKGMTVKTL
ncbi:hypothetical protein B1B04_10410 [Lysinibacillus sp. KCTC 33748]|uniref:hypothetical protein n=1 Tax=unclassified Lysinibacillus TaxID=2636778 RepID=UPI0009A5EF99|nr:MULTISPECIES: hypothetical protein [unclassified Lysinibacillus]OXS74017.1 hypothetical protein B1B04_10410 [Lysinibacillus sp. KCTC 33748]SKB69252.1 hypothetical protein SAMN06295926_10639 [Lysinibacillus sp. AC-3]